MLKKTGFATGTVAAGTPGRRRGNGPDDTGVPHPVDGTLRLCGSDPTVARVPIRHSPGSVGAPVRLPGVRTAVGGGQHH
ncbi:hypothetical protein [Amycolatopsis circi]|uniref:hypothetical protein n=1 Tax=Amycolatopsis circi TaxID=871959 RepID=UPI000E22E9EA|nr:hypothetical protein [Amycolatopsis circi]